MADQSKVSISPIFFNMIAGLAATELGETWHFRRKDGKIIACKTDEGSQVIKFSMTFDDYSFGMEEDEITFHNIKEFLSSLKIQGYPKESPTLTRKLLKGTDAILIKQGKANVWHRLSAKRNYAARYGFDKFIDARKMEADAELPKMLIFDLTRDDVQSIYDKASKFKSELLSFTKNSDGIVINFTSETDKVSEYSHDLLPEEVINFENTTITDVTRFPYKFFHILRAVNCDVRVLVFGSESRAGIAFYGSYVNGNVSVDVSATCPSKL
jgi:hypothetical protein